MHKKYYLHNTTKHVTVKHRSLFIFYMHYINILKKRKKNNHNLNKEENKHKKFLINLPKIAQKIEFFQTLYSPKEFNNTLLRIISQAYHRIYLVALYLENDQGGNDILNTLFQIKILRPTINIKILVDWYRAQRSKIGIDINTKKTNWHWYNHIANQYPNTKILIYGIPIHINEILGVLHLKGFIIDDKILYSGANLNNEYLHIKNKYRYDRYHIIHNKQLSDIMSQYIDATLLSSKVVKKLENNNECYSPKQNLKKNNIRLFRRKLRKICYLYQNNANYNEFSITPLVGLGKDNLLNQTIQHLICSTDKKIILCTPYFNIPKKLTQKLLSLLKQGKTIEIIIGDKTSNDFYISPEHHNPFTFIHILPYLYEMNLRTFLKKLQEYIDKKLLIIRLWKKDNNSYHIKGIWIDDEWQLLTGNNLNPRSLKYDLENALLIHDPKNLLFLQKAKELNNIRMYTQLINHYTTLQNISAYPTKIRKIIYRIHRTGFDLLINRIL